MAPTPRRRGRGRALLGRRFRAAVSMFIGSDESADTTVDPSESSFTADDFDISADGVATATFAPVGRNEAGEALANKDVVLTRERITFSVGNSLVDVNVDTIADDGATRCYVQITAKDASSRGIPNLSGSDFTIAVSGTGNTVTQATGSTNQSGVLATGYFVSTVAEAKTITVSYRGAALTDTASCTVTGSPPAAAFNNEDPAFVELVDWNDEATMNITGLNDNGSMPYRTTTQVNFAGATITFPDANTIRLSSGDWSTRVQAETGGGVGQWGRLSGTALNNVEFVITGYSGTDLYCYGVGRTGAVFTVDTTPDAAWSMEHGWGKKERVTSGYAATSLLGGTAAIYREYLGGVGGGHDAARNEATFPSGVRRAFQGAELEFGGDSATAFTTSLGGGKQLFFTFNGGASRYFLNYDAGYGVWTLWKSSTLVASSTVALVTGAKIKIEWETDADTGENTIWIDDAVAISYTDPSPMAADLYQAYDDGSDNGNYTTNHPSTKRYIGVPGGTEVVTLKRWLSRYRISYEP